MVDFDNDDYELLPHQEIERLRSENNRLKQNPFKDRAEPKDLQGSIDNLTEAINKLMKLFSDTNHEMLKEFKTSSIQENFKMISSQNEKIAEGILTVAQLVQMPSQETQSNIVNDDLNEGVNEGVDENVNFADNSNSAEISVPVQEVQAPVPVPVQELPPRTIPNQVPGQVPGQGQVPNQVPMGNPQGIPASHLDNHQEIPPPPQQMTSAPPPMPSDDVGNLPPPPPHNPHVKKKGFGLFK